MKKSSDDIIRLIAEIEEDLRQLAIIYSNNQKGHERIIQGADDYLDLAALGFTIHNLYSLMENTCYRIAKFFENNLRSDSWHKDLLERMKLNLPEVRLAFFDEETYLLLDELRAFRHLFRNLYGRPIHKKRILMVQQSVPEAYDRFRKASDAYIVFLHKLRQKID